MGNACAQHKFWWGCGRVDAGDGAESAGDGFAGEKLWGSCGGGDMMVIFADRRSRDGRTAAKMSFVSPLCRTPSAERQSGDTKFSFGLGAGIH